MIYARYLYPGNGTAASRDKIQKVDLQVGKKYAVERIEIGQSNTGVYLLNYTGPFNSVNFEFEEDGKWIDIYRDPRFNSYIRKRKT